MLSHKVEDFPNVLSLFQALATICSRHWRITFGKLVRSGQMERKIANSDIRKWKCKEAKSCILEYLSYTELGGQCFFSSGNDLKDFTFPHSRAKIWVPCNWTFIFGFIINLVFLEIFISIISSFHFGTNHHFKLEKNSYYFI